METDPRGNLSLLPNTEGNTVIFSFVLIPLWFSKDLL